MSGDRALSLVQFFAALTVDAGAFRRSLALSRQHLPARAGSAPPPFYPSRTSYPQSNIAAAAATRTILVHASNLAARLTSLKPAKFGKDRGHRPPARHRSWRRRRPAPIFRPVTLLIGGGA